MGDDSLRHRFTCHHGEWERGGGGALYMLFRAFSARAHAGAGVISFQISLLKISVREVVMLSKEA